MTYSTKQKLFITLLLLAFILILGLAGRDEVNTYKAQVAVNSIAHLYHGTN